VSYDYINVHYPSVEGCADKLRATTSGINDMLNNLESELALLKESWIGEAKTAYEGAKNRWDQQVIDMGADLRKAEITLTDMAGNIARTDWSCSNGFNGS